MEQVTVQEPTLRERSKKALILAILAEAIPTAVAILTYFTYLIGFFGVLIANDFELDSPVPIIVMVLVMLIGFVGAGVVMIVLGAKAWRKARAIGLDARESGVRRPPVSVVAHVIGLAVLVEGIAFVVIMLGCVCCFSFFGLIFAML